MEDKKLKCDVRGFPHVAGVCGYIIVGGKYCGYKGKCPHQKEEEKQEDK